MKRCEGKTKEGARCNRIVSGGFCYAHDESKKGLREREFERRSVAFMREWRKEAKTKLSGKKWLAALKGARVA